MTVKYFRGEITKPVVQSESREGWVWVLCAQLYERPRPMRCIFMNRIPSIGDPVILVQVDGVEMVVACDFNAQLKLYETMVADMNSEDWPKLAFYPSNNLEQWLEIDNEKGLRIRCPDGGDSELVRWDKLKPIISAMWALVIAHVHITAWGPSGPPTNASSMSSEKSKIDGDEPSAYKDSW